MKKLFILLFLIVTYSEGFTSNNPIYFEGRVAGYEQISFKLLKKIKKNFDYQGGLSRVAINIIQDGKKKRIYTNIDGSFKIELNTKGLYNISFYKKGYTSSSFVINTKNIPIKYFSGLNTFTGAEFILVKTEENEKKKAKIGTYFYDKRKRNFNFSSTQKSDENWVKNAVYLANKSVSLNYASFQSGSAIVEDGKLAKDTMKTMYPPNNETEIIIKDLKKVEDFLLRNDEISENQIEEYTKLLSKVKADLSKQKSASKQNKIPALLIANLEAELRFIEGQLKKSRELLELREKEVAQSKKIIWLGTSLVVVLLLTIGYFVYTLFQRKKINEQLVGQNKIIKTHNIAMNESISYAASIQQSLFKKPNVLNLLFKENFIFFKPKDTISGDFYWFEQIEGKKIIISGDCTGHGVPGALLTMLANSFLNEVVLNQNVTKPSKILQLLNNHLHNTFPKNSLFGMEVSVICVDELNKSIVFSGIINGIYKFSNGELNELKANILSIGRNEINDESQIQEEVIQYQKDDILYLYSDGYTDQFGGKNREKLNKDRFEKLLITCSNSFSKAEKISKDYFEEWRGENKQIDDVLLIGIKV